VLKEARQALGILVQKTGFGFLRYVHFLALAYLAYALAGPNGDNLRHIRGPFVAICCKVGQQSLAVFLAGQFLSLMGGIYFNQFGATNFNTVLVNLTGFALLIAVAYSVAYFKSSPWKRPKSANPASAARQDRQSTNPNELSQPAE